ncbi:MAG: hypothetical protein NZ874_02825, partial [Fimbriimonadales bacterium]|nr:hypothetical protein [Fimbriimonadales bacterium]
MLTVDDITWKAFTDEPQYVEAIFRHGLPELHARIDWQRGVEFLDKELAQVAPRAMANPQIVDKLLRVYLKDGTEEWILIHIEIQSHPEPQFEERMFAYYAAIWLRYRRRVVSVALLADDNPNWRPSRYEQETGGCRVVFDFATLKLIDLNEQVLIDAGDPASLILASFVRSVRTKRMPNVRYQARLEFLRLALERGYNEEEIRQILAFLERAMRLPAELEEQYEQILEEVRRQRGGDLIS